MDFHRRLRLSAIRFEADANGIRILENGGLVDLPWSTVLGIDIVPAPARRFAGLCRVRSSVVLRLADGSDLAPGALRRVPAGVARRVEDLWARYGFLGASAMWGRPASPRPTPSPGPAATTASASPASPSLA